MTPPSPPLRGRAAGAWRRAGAPARVGVGLVVLCGLALVTALAAVGLPASEDPTSAPTPGADRPAPGTDRAAAGADRRTPDETSDATARTTVPAPLPCLPTTVEGQAASVLLVGIPGVEDASDPLVDDLVELGVGGILLNGTNVTSTEQLQALTAGLAARFDGHLTIALDQEGGRVSPLRNIGMGGPSARRLGAQEPDAIEAAGLAAGREVAAVGATMVLGPVADLDDGPAGAVIGDRSFGAEPEVVGEAARRYARGLRAAGVAAVVKHWPGYAMAPDTHFGAGSADVDGDELEQRHMAAFLPVLAEEVEAVMTSHVSYPSLGEHPASLNPETYRLLREAGYQGAAMTDALGMGSIHTRWGFDRSPAMALAAGADVILANQGGEARVMRDGIVTAVAAGEVAPERLAEAVDRAATLRPGC